MLKRANEFLPEMQNSVKKLNNLIQKNNLIAKVKENQNFDLKSLKEELKKEAIALRTQVQEWSEKVRKEFEEEKAYEIVIDEG